MSEEISNRLHNALVKMVYLYQHETVTKEDIDAYYGKLVNHLTRHSMSSPSRLSFDMMLYNQLKLNSAWDALAIVTKKCLDKGQLRKTASATDALCGLVAP